MPAYYYLAVTHHGQEQKGVIEAENEKQARQLIRDKSLIPINIRAQQEKKSSGQRRLFRFQRGLKTKELALITRQFATLLAAGLPVEEALLAVAEQNDHSHVKGLVLAVRSKVVAGHSLAAALRDHPDAFSELFCATVAAGEKSGYLNQVLLRLADYIESQWQLHQKLTTALIYPLMIILVAMAIVAFLLEYVVPKMITVYSHLNQTLPLMTRILITISQSLKQDGLYALLLLAAIGAGGRHLYQKNPLFREKMHRLFLRLPLIGHALNTANTARFSRTLSILSAAGVPVLEAMKIAGELITMVPIRKAVEEAVHRVKEGAAIHLALKQAGFFSPMSVHMIASGETSGQLEKMLERVADNQENEIKRMIEVALALFEPIIILIMGMIVLFIVLAVLLPIFQLNQFS